MPDSADAIIFDPTKPESFTVWCAERVRWGDLDSMGHVNNASVARYAETGRIHYAEQVDGLLADTNTIFTLARVAINFRLEIHYPGEVCIGSRVMRVGRSSFTLAQGMFKDDACTTTTEAVMVLIDRTTHKSLPIPDDLRHGLLHPGP